LKGRGNFKRVMIANQTMCILVNGETVNLMGKGNSHTGMEANMREPLLTESSIALMKKKQYNKRGSTSRTTANCPSSLSTNQQTVKSTKGSSRMD
jgi:hypothetical protein